MKDAGGEGVVSGCLFGPPRAGRGYFGEPHGVTKLAVDTGSALTPGRRLRSAIMVFSLSKLLTVVSCTLRRETFCSPEKAGFLFCPIFPLFLLFPSFPLFLLSPFHSLCSSNFLSLSPPGSLPPVCLLSSPL